jgi:opine dehydrogenase
MVCVAVLGAGHGGLYMAAYLAQQGHIVRLWNRSPEKIAEVNRRGGINVQTVTEWSKGIQIPIATATTDIADALKGCTHVLIIVSATGHAEVARKCAPFLHDGQSILILPGRSGGALNFRAALDAAGCKADILLGEGNTLPVAARTIAPATSFSYGTKSFVLVAALPATLTQDLLQCWEPLLPMLEGAISVLHTGLANFGAILHPTILLLNATRIRRGEPFDFYTEGVSAEVADAISDADAERMSIARAYGVPHCSLQAWLERSYGHRARNLRDALRHNPCYAGIRAPATLQHRYLLEDVPTGLLPMIELGRVAGLLLPALRRILRAAYSAMGPDAPAGRTLARMGLESCTVHEIIRVANGVDGCGKDAGTAAESNGDGDVAFEN